MGDEAPAPLSSSPLPALFSLAGCEGWELLHRHLELAEGFSFAVITAPDDWSVAYLRQQFPALLDSPGAWQHLVFDPSQPPESLAELLLNLPTPPQGIRALWLDAEPGPPESLPDRDVAWGNALARLNRYRNTLSARLPCALLLAIPVRILPILRASAPDLWAIRSGLFRVEPPGVTSASSRWIEPQESNLPAIGGDYRQTLAEADKLRGKPGRELLLARLLHRAGRQAHEALQWRSAEQALQEAYNLVQTYGADPEERVDLSLTLGSLFQEEANFERSEFYQRRAVAEAEQHLGEEHRLFAVALNDLAQLLEATNRLSEAEPLMRRALAIDEASYGDSHPSVATDLSNLALLLQDTNRAAEAEPLMRRALTIDEASYGDSHPSVATKLNNLAGVLRETNQVAEAELLMRRALAIRETSYGDSHPSVATVLNNLAHLLQKTGRLAEAEPLMRRALGIREASYGNSHPRVATALINLASLLQDTNRVAEAEPLMRRALAIDEASYGDNHPEVAVDLGNLARLLSATDRLTEAEPLMQRQLEILLRFTRENKHQHPHLQDAISNYRDLLIEIGNTHAEAEEKIRGLMARYGVRSLTAEAES